MATSRVKVWIANEVLTAADLNAEFNNLINNFTDTADYASTTSGKGSALLGFNVSAAYAAGTIQEAIKDRGISLKNFPFLAVGDGVANDTTAIDSAVSAAFDLGVPLIWPRGTYKYSGVGATLVSNYSGKSFIWRGFNATLNCTTVDEAFWQVFTADEFTLMGLKVNGPGAVGGAPSEAHFGFACYGCAKGTIAANDIRGFIGDGILLSAQLTGGPPVLTDACRNVDIYTNNFDNNGRGGLTIVGGDAIGIHNNTFGASTLPGAPAAFPGLHIEAVTTSDRYGVDNIDIYGNTFFSYPTIISAKHTAVVSDPDAWIHFHHNKIKTATEVALSGVGCGNFNGHDNEIVSTFAGVGSTSQGLLWLKGGNIRLSNNWIKCGTSEFVFHLSYWKTVGAIHEVLDVSDNNHIELTSAVTDFFRILGDNGVYSTKTWDLIKLRHNGLIPFSGGKFISMNPDVTAVKAIVEGNRSTASLGTVLEFGTNIPASSKIVFKDTTLTATTAFNVPNVVAFAVALVNSKITGAYSGVGASGNTVFNSRLRIQNLFDGAGAPNSSVDCNSPAIAGTLTAAATGKYTIDGLLGNMIPAGSSFSTHVYTNLAADFRAHLSSDGAGSGTAIKALVYSAGALTNMPANGRMSIIVEYPESLWTL